jgi:UDP-glucuronate 4-epimerase
MIQHSCVRSIPCHVSPLHHVTPLYRFQVEPDYSEQGTLCQANFQTFKTNITMKLPNAASLPSLSAMCDSDDTSTDGSSSQGGSVISSSHRSTPSLEISEIGGGPKRAVVEPHVGYKKVLVTGGAGFIGSHVAEALLKRGDDVVIVDEMNDYYDVRIKEQNLATLREKYPNNVTIYIGDICDEELMLRVFETERPEWICHLAARAGVRPSIQDPYIYIHSNIKGTTHLMELSAKFGVKNFVFASSSSVYGSSKSTFFSEDEATDFPDSPYAASKKACELMAHTYHHLYHLPLTALRFFTVFGPRGRKDMAPFIFIDRVSRGLEIQQFGDGTSSRDYTYIDDIVDGVVRSIDRPYAFEIFNLGKGSGTSLKEFIGLVQKHVGKEAVIRVMPDQPGDVPYTCADVSKAHALLGYKAKVTFEEGIHRTVNWYRKAYNANPAAQNMSSKRVGAGLGQAPTTVALN